MSTMDILSPLLLLIVCLATPLFFYTLFGIALSLITRKRFAPDFFSLLSTFAIGAIFAFILVPNFLRVRAPGNLSCKSNLKNLGTALEMYSADNGGRYPPSLAKLIEAGRYLRSIPVCPNLEYERRRHLSIPEFFRPSLIHGPLDGTYGYVVATKPDSYTVWCIGELHKRYGSPRNYPQYSSNQGLVER